jgi:hypothetical protein
VFIYLIFPVPVLYLLLRRFGTDPRSAEMGPMNRTYDQLEENVFDESPYR